MAMLFSKIRLNPEKDVDTTFVGSPEVPWKANDDGLYPKRYYAYFTQACLAAAVMAAHQDLYFVNFILDQADRKFIDMQPGRMDDRIIGEPAGVVAQAILSSSFGAATTIS
ncbi:hypothetical protein E8E12_008557 [Didymella heteroderae]|uniref:Uncharacterized protein n=1 Tax=Didymella heteroderae TaxID=1769908 RepID=A0A9P4WT95_9PLEO|nr:hypothetical protein E8E12_008557 [Didymella heteroderae]